MGPAGSGRLTPTAFVAVPESKGQDIRKVEPPVNAGMLAYAAPVTGSYFFYIPMWSILPGIYAKYFGLGLTSVATVILFVRLFDGASDLTIGYLSDRHRAAGGSRKLWVIVGGMGATIACFFLFIPPLPTTTTYYLAASLAYFFFLAAADIPHLTWGSELTLEYRQRAQVYGVRNIMSKIGISAFYALPLFPIFSSTDYTPQVLQVALWAGACITVIGLLWAFFVAPEGLAVGATRKDSPRLLAQSILQSKPVLLFFAAILFETLCYGMWYGLLYIYLDSYLGIGHRLAIILLIATIAGTLTTPLWLGLIHKTSKATAWAVGIVLFLIQLPCTLLIRPGDSWWMAFGVVFFANLCFTAHDVAALSAMGDISDYGKLKFRVDRGATYFAIANLIGKIGLGVGGGLALGIAGTCGFSTADAIHSRLSVWGLKLGFIVLPACFAIVALLLIVRTPINPRRHRIIQRRIESRLGRIYTIADGDLNNSRTTE
jgi:GPH family glycoside/pentoside/hexuronide:cation symporter